jgi:hypothetical protein
MSSSVHSAATDAGDHPVVETGARLGYAASGLLHLLIAWVALQLAWSTATQEASQSGALRTLAETPVGSVALWVALVGFVLLGVWLLLEAVVVHDTGDRLKAAGKGVVYAVLAWTTFGVARGSGSGSGSEQSVSMTADLMAQPFGLLLVGAVGVGVVAVGAYHVAKGWRRTFLEDLTGHPGTWITRAGRAGYMAKGVALGVVGVLLVYAAATHDPAQAQGLDGALRTVLGAPLGKVLLTVVALGLASYGVYSFARARYARV